ncbi:alginate O-acetyltransferase AlgX-related protein [Candidatus Allofournierella merdipullorum]|uniref:alginate O-acetyltransferase AlgX-related protein n=1 Tax=Candidatus Allofournierella merdipullorum TaxID=2838595 RepID=UPI003AB85725
MSHHDRERRGCPRALIAGFAALLAGPCLLWPLVRGMCDTTNYENRTLAAFPTAATGVRAWPAAFEEWLGDHAPFRNQFLTLKSGADRLVGTLDSTNVLLGKEGWLFLKDVSDSKSLSDYQGLTAYSAEETAAMAQALTALNDVLAAKGSRLLVLFAPAKEGVYSRYMPDSVPVVSRPTRVGALAGALGETGVPVLFPLEELEDAALERQVYYKYDTHWNEAGAWLAAQLTLEALDRPFAAAWPEMSADPEKAPLTDLANMCGSWAWCTDDVYWALDAVPAQCTLWEAGGEIARYAGEGEGSLLLARDSFGEALAPWLAQGFADTTVLHGNQMQVETLLEWQPEVPDVVVLEVAERFSDNLLGRLETMRQWAESVS